MKWELFKNKTLNEIIVSMFLQVFLTRAHRTCTIESTQCYNNLFEPVFALKLI